MFAAHSAAVLRLLALLALLSAPPAVAPALAQPAAVDAAAAAAELTTYQSEHYTLHTNLDREEAVPFGRHMDAVFKEYSQRFRNFGPRNRGRRAEDSMPLYLFRTQEQYMRFLGEHGINGANTGGMFFIQPQVQGLATWTQGKSLTSTFAVLQHEGFHQFAFNFIGPDLPIWVNEGLAQYFEDGILVNGRMHTGLAHGRRIAAVRGALEQDKAIDFDRLLGMSDEEWHRSVASGSDEASLLYDQSWSMAYFLVHGDGGRYQQAFERYLSLVAQKKDSVDAFEEAFGTRDTDAFRERWEAFALEVEPDNLNVAMERMEFLGQALKFLHDRNERVPTTAEQLRSHLQRIGFRATRQEPGRTTQVNAQDEALYQYTLPDGKTERFKLLEAEAPDLLPRITAPGLTPQPTLAWRRDSTGELMAEVVFR